MDGLGEAEADPSRGATTCVVGEVDGGAATTMTGFMSCLPVPDVKYCPPMMGIDPDFSSPICVSHVSRIYSRFVVVVVGGSGNGGNGRVVVGVFFFVIQKEPIV